MPCEGCGKLIVAAGADEIGALEALATRGDANGVTDLEVVDRALVRRREPHVEAAAATWSPSTGILEAEAYVRALARVAAAREVALLPGAASTAASRVPTAWRSGPRARRSSPATWSTPRACTPTKSPPRSAARPSRSTRSGATTPSFHAAARRLLPDLELHQLRPGGSGIRARGALAEQTFSDFLIRRDRRQPRLVQAAGIDSFGLTASLAIAERVADLVDETLVQESAP